MDVVAVVPVDDGTDALRLLRGVPLVVHSVSALLAARCLDLVVIVGPPRLVECLQALMGTLSNASTAIDVQSVAGVGTGTQVAAVLATLPDSCRTVMVHDPSHPLAGAGLVVQVLAALMDGAAADDDVVAAVPVRPVIDTLKLVDGEQVITETVARGGFRQAYTPQAYLRGPLQRCLSRADDAAMGALGPDALPRLAQSGGRLLSVPAPGEPVRITSEEDLLLAEAMLSVREQGGPGFASG